MSALAQQHTFFSLRLFSEVEMVRMVGKIACDTSHSSEEQGLAAIATALLRVRGITGFRFQPQEEQPHLRTYKTGKTPSRIAASVISVASANGQSWGQIRIFFDLQVAHSLESPVRLAKFVGQQVAILLRRIALQREREKLISRLEAMRRFIRRRKIIHRAVAVLASQRKISGAEALSVIAAYARRNRRPMLSIAESLIFGYATANFARPSLRRLGCTELTSQHFQRSLA